jgi:hypothetical protein
MTLIAKFDCPSENGMVMLADSQETVGDYRVEVKKIAPKTVGKYEIAIGGAGYVGPLIDGMTSALENAFSAFPSGKNECDLKGLVGGVVLSYHRNEVKHYPARQKDKFMEFLVCARNTESREMFSWRITGTAINTAKNYELLGWETGVYHEVVRPYFDHGSPPLPIQQAIVLGLRLFMLAEKSSNYVNKPTILLVITPDQIYSEDPIEVSAMRQRVSRYDELLRELMISIPDTSIPEDVMSEKIAKFGGAVLKLHNAFIAAAGTRAFWSGRIFNNLPPYLGWPLGTEFTMGADGRFDAKQINKEQHKGLNQLVTTPIMQIADFDTPYQLPSGEQKASKEPTPSAFQKSEPEPNR